jgi:hypothetical protein
MGLRRLRHRDNSGILSTREYQAGNEGSFNAMIGPLVRVKCREWWTLHQKGTATDSSSPGVDELEDTQSARRHDGGDGAVVAVQ